ncbi:hypothetical protein HNR26_004605 [Rhizobium rosettiformans]|uniref:Porin n=2 Tax=Rhizobium rosettiformans TaxID=1368430 RepID=A0A4S8PK50_9HYPH|nr:hypothetical protein [Rhizobium rosettiformans]MBB5278504.1 hypothetical protein [Rhizobium rosettiformans]THV31080.1 hypothetical protein FAA86_22490 [Rhizobium rosettiformans W3]
MKTLIAFGLLSLAASPAFAQDCTYHERQPVQKDGNTQHRFTDSCGKPYEVGYRLEGNTLHFPRGGQHSLPETTEAEAERILRDTYGLVGGAAGLVRTKGL